MENGIILWEHARNVEENKTGALTRFFSLSSPKEERPGVRSRCFSGSNPLAPALAPLGRGEGVGTVSRCIPCWTRSAHLGLCVEFFGYAVAAPVSLALRRSSRSALIFFMVGSSSL